MKPLVVTVAVIVLVALCLLPFASEIYGVMSAPLLAQLPEGSNMVAVQVARVMNDDPVRAVATDAVGHRTVHLGRRQRGERHVGESDELDVDAAQRFHRGASLLLLLLDEIGSIGVLRRTTLGEDDHGRPSVLAYRASHEPPTTQDLVVRMGGHHEKVTGHA